MLSSSFFLLIGLAILIVGAELLVKGSASLARRLGVSKLVIGLTVVAFGTSAPELFVNMYSAYKSQPDIAIGNVIGSNIANILLILGVSSIVRPLRVKGGTIWKEIPFALLGVLLVFTMGNDVFFDGGTINAISRTDGFSLIAMFAVFIFYTFGIAKIDGEPEDVQEYSIWIGIALIFGGLLALIGGGKLVIDNAVALARIAGLSEAFIGLTIIAIGTSLPELFTSVVAVWRGHNDMAIGNVVGSNIFNVFWILGLTSTFLQLPFNPLANVDVVVVIVATVALFVAVFIGKKHTIERWQGILFLIAYISYLAYLVNRG